jgi:hypothetical protein
MVEFISIRRMEMARTSETVTQQEIEAYVKFCKDYNVVNYDGRDPDTLANAEFVLRYFLEVWKQDMTTANFALAFPQMKSHLKFYSSPQHAEYTHIANENIHAAQQLSAWLDTQGKPGQLVNTGDQAFENLRLLLIELRGRPVDSQRIHEAMGRISFKPGRQLHFLPEPRKQDPRQHQDDGTGFLGKHVNEPRWKRLQREREEREAREAASQSSASAHSVAVREAREKAEGLRGNTHSESEQIARLFVTTSTNEIDWVQTLAARLNLQKSLNRAQEVRKFIR